MPSMRGQCSAICSEPNRPQRSIAAPITSWPAMRIPTVAVIPIRGPAYVIVRTMIAHQTAEQHPPRLLDARAKPSRLWCATARMTTAIAAVRAVENAERLEHADALAEP